MHINKREIDLPIDALISNPRSPKALIDLRHVLYKLALGAKLEPSNSNDTAAIQRELRDHNDD